MSQGPMSQGRMDPGHAYRPVPPQAIFAPHSATVGVGRDDLVSGEAVALDLPPASIGLRVLSGIIDIVLGIGVYIALRWLSLKLVGSTDDALILAATTLCAVIALVMLPTASETFTRGKTLGHCILGLRTVRDDAGPIGFRHAITRAMLGVVEIYGCLGAPAFLAAVISRKGKRFGDMLAGTYVIRDRHRLSALDPILMPPGMEGWASTADIAPLPDGLAVMIRQFLGRRRALTPQSRAVLAQRLVVDCMPFVAPPPPMAAPPEIVLEAIMAERRERDTERLAREDQLRRRLLG